MYVMRAYGQITMLVVCLNFKACYNKCIIFGLKGNDSMTQVLFELGLWSFKTVLINSRIVFTRSWFVCQNGAVSHVRHKGLYMV